MSKNLILNWDVPSNVKGGTETVMELIAEIAETQVIDFQTASKLSNLHLPSSNYRYELIDKTVIFDRFIEQYENLNQPDVIIRNGGCGSFYKPKCKVINYFQDPHKLIGKFYNSVGNASWDFEFNEVFPALHKQSADGAINVANSNFMKQYLEKELKIECHAVIHPGIDMDKFKPQEPPYLPETKGFKKVALWIGRHNPFKYGFIPELVKNNPDIFWILVFSHPLQNKKVKAENVEIFENLSQEQLIELYNRADFTISTSPVESCSLVILESASCGKPIICFRTGIVWDWFDERLGIRVEEHTLEKFQEAITKIKNDDLDKYNPRQAIIDKGLTKENFKKEINKLMGDKICQK